jgi:aspartate carbamoyltransferase regulatory subunit
MFNRKFLGTKINSEFINGGERNLVSHINPKALINIYINNQHKTTKLKLKAPKGRNELINV